MADLPNYQPACGHIILSSCSDEGNISSPQKKQGEMALEVFRGQQVKVGTLKEFFL